MPGDDADLRQSLGESPKPYEAIDSLVADNGASALIMAETNDFDAILLDVCLLDMDGRDVCRLLRRRGVQIPILMPTEHDGYRLAA